MQVSWQCELFEISTYMVCLKPIYVGATSNKPI